MQSAPAKVNLMLAIAGRAPDGYHFLESLAMFAVNAADEVGLAPLYSASGRFASHLPANPEEDLAMRALALFAKDCPTLAKNGVRLVKNLPVAAGLGSGSADAAALLRFLTKLHPDIWSAAQLQDRLAELGADVPACFMARALWMERRGDICTPASMGFRLWAVLAAPPFGLATKEVYRAVEAKEITMPPVLAVPKKFAALDDLMRFLRPRRNALEAPAISVRPELGDMLAAFKRETAHALLSRMSGSGPACFALFASEEEANTVKQNLAQRFPDWWMEASELV